MTKAAAQGAARPSRCYFDLHDQLAALEKAGLLLKVDIPVNKDTEIHPLMRWQFRGGLDENDPAVVNATMPAAPSIHQ